MRIDGHRFSLYEKIKKQADRVGKSMLEPKRFLAVDKTIRITSCNYYLDGQRII